ncbi:hypothetical protein A2U01_0080901, partial [Trifolium medium]|nr:hypothetical protein [Trifolium medium]
QRSSLGEPVLGANLDVLAECIFLVNSDAELGFSLWSVKNLDALLMM